MSYVNYLYKGVKLKVSLPNMLKLGPRHAFILS